MKASLHLCILYVQARQLMAQSLRYVAHLYGASLVYLGGLKSPRPGLQGSSGHLDAAADKAALANFRSMLSHMLFVGMDKRMYASSTAASRLWQNLSVPWDLCVSSPKQGWSMAVKQAT